MFNPKLKQLEAKYEAFKEEVFAERRDCKRTKEELKAEHALELKELDFKMRHLKDETVRSLNETLTKKDQRVAVLEKEKEMMEKIVNVNSDIIDVKELITKLIDKLPAINLTNLTTITKDEGAI